MFAVVLALSWGGAVRSAEDPDRPPEEALAEAVGSGGFRAQLRAMDRALADWGPVTPPRAVPALLAALRKGAVALVRADAAGALADVREVPLELVPALQAAQSDLSILGEVEVALSRLSMRAALGDVEAKAKGQSEAIRVAAAAKVLAVCPERTDFIPLLRTALVHNEPNVYPDVVEGLWAIGSRGGFRTWKPQDLQQISKPLAAHVFLSTDQGRSRLLTAALLELVGGTTTESTEFLDKATWKVEDREARVVAIQVRRLKGSDIRRLLSDPNTRVRQEALRSVRRGRSKVYDWHLQEILKSGPEISWEGALVALAEQKDSGRSLIPFLLMVSKALPPEVLTDVLEGMDLDGRAVPLVCALREVADGPALEEARTGLVSLGAAAVPFLLWTFDEAPSHVRIRVATVLGKMGPAAGAATLEIQKRIDDGDPMVEEALRDAFRAIAGTEPLEVKPRGPTPFFAGRFGALRHPQTLLGAEGGRGTEAAVAAALDWLARHQSPDGSWDCDGFGSLCKSRPCGGEGEAAYDPGVTGLALLVFLGAGETHLGPKYGDPVSRGLRRLADIQDTEGCFGPKTSEKFIYNHALATLALAEAYGMTGTAKFRRSAQAGVDFIEACRNPYLAWRYGVRPQDNDTSVTGWMVMALHSAREAGLRVDEEAFEGAKYWLDKVTEPEHGRTGYTARGNGPDRPKGLEDGFPADKSESLTAVAVLTRIFCGATKEDEYVKKGADLCLKSLPVYDEAAGTIDYCYWYYGTLAMFQVGGDYWKKWNESMKKSIIEIQRLDKSEDRWGSWDPVDPWGPAGGRIYSTAINASTLETYYRYPRVLKRK